MPATNVTLAAASVNYNLLTLIQALTGFSQTKPTCRELTVQADSGNQQAVIYRVESNGDANSAAYQLTAGQSQTYRSTTNDVPLSVWFRTDTPGAKLGVEFNYF